MPAAQPAEEHLQAPAYEPETVASTAAPAVAPAAPVLANTPKESATEPLSWWIVILSLSGAVVIAAVAVGIQKRAKG